jgi:uncharacterized protein YcbK (DUF882 family)
MIEDIQLSENFYLSEFVNTKDRNKVKLSVVKLIPGLQFCRNILGPMTITSGYRSEGFNKIVGGSPRSYHLKGYATDFKANFNNMSKMILCKIFKAAGFTNCKFYYKKNSKGIYCIDRCHVDVGPTWNNKEFCVLANKYE